jgi:hypothetical protein
MNAVTRISFYTASNTTTTTGTLTFNIAPTLVSSNVNFEVIGDIKGSTTLTLGETTTPTAEPNY